MNVKKREHEYFLGFKSSLKYIRNGTRYERSKNNKFRSLLSSTSFSKSQDGLCKKLDKCVPITSPKRLRKLRNKHGF